MIQPQTFLCLGASHRNAPVALREQLRRVFDEVIAALPAETAVEEYVLLATCNRVELYAGLADAGESPGEELWNLLARAWPSDAKMLNEIVTICTGAAAIDHLFHVAAGLDSMVLGESQILGQVMEAHLSAVAQQTSGPFLSTIFQAAIRAAKRAHSETAIGRNPASAPSAAIALAQQTMGNLIDRQILVVGAGDMARLALKGLRNRRVSHIAVANRTRAHTAGLLVKGSGQVYDLAQLPQAIASADVVISAVRTGEPIIDNVTLGDRRRPLVLIDLAVPRSIAPTVREQLQVQLFDIDDLKFTLDKSLAKRRAEIPFVEAIINEEKDRLHEALMQLRIKPLIAEMRRKAEEIRQAEWERTLRYIGDIDPQAMVHLQHFSRSLVNRLLHEPTVRLRRAAGDEAVDLYAGTVRELFGLES